MFTFDKETRKDRRTGLPLGKLKDLNNREIGTTGIVIIDCVMYNPNHDIYLYCAMEYLHRSNGSF